MNLLILLALLNPVTLSVSSSAFLPNSPIPIEYTCQGKSINPPLSVAGIPKEAKSLVIIIEDPDTEKGTFDHWVTWNIKPTPVIEENSIPGTQGKNSENKLGYTGPCPPDGRHRYFFKVYALDAMLNLKEGANKTEVLKAIKGHILANGELIWFI